MRLYCGIDISDRSIEVVALAKERDTVRVVKTARVVLSSGLVDRGVVQDAKALGAVLGAVLDANLGRTRRFQVAVSLPETQVYSKVVSLPSALDEAMAKAAVMTAAADFMPLSIESCFTAVHPLGVNGGETRDWVLTAVPKEVFAGFREVAAVARVAPAFFDSEAASIARAARLKESPFMVADIGARTTIVAVVDGGLRLSASLMVGGDFLTEAVETRLGVPLVEAERIKRRAGFDTAVEDGRVMLILQKPMTEIIEEIRHTMSYYVERHGRPIRVVALSGGTSLLPSFVEYLKSNFPGVTVGRIDPFRGLEVDDFPGAADVRREAVLYATATGLALRLAAVVTEPSLVFPGVEKRPSTFSFLIELVKPLLMPKKAKSPSEGRAAKKKSASVPGGKKVSSREVPAASLGGEGETPAGKTSETVLTAPSVSEPVAAPSPAASSPAQGYAGQSAGQAAPILPPELVQAQVPAAAVEVAAELKPAKSKEKPAETKEAVEVKAIMPPVAPAPAPEPVEENLPEAVSPAELVEAIETEPPQSAIEVDLPVVPHELPAPEPVEENLPEADEKDYGLGIGDILAGADVVEPPTPLSDELEPEPVKTGVKRLKIEEILGRRHPETMAESGPDDELDAASVPEPRSRRPFPWLIVLLVLMFLAAAGSVFLFMGKFGLPTKLFGGGSDQAAELAVPTEEPAAPSVDGRSVVLNLLLTTGDETSSDDREAVKSRLVETEVSATASFSATGEAPAPAQASGTVRAVGTIKVVNKSGAPVPLVEKTRFQTSDGVLFRMKSHAVIAASGETPVEVYADVPGAAGNIAPATFTVPGLAGTSLASLVTGRSDVAMSGGSEGQSAGAKVKAVSADDLAAAKKDLAARLLKEALGNFDAMVGQSESVSSDLVIGADVSVDAPAAGTPGEKFTVKLTQRYQALLIPEEPIAALLAERLPGSLPAGADAASFTVGKPNYIIEAHPEPGKAQVRVEAPVVPR
jgi:type IV pilus assembly protein PilM